MAKSRVKPRGALSSRNGSIHDVMTLAETASFLRLTEEDVLRMVGEQDLPARQTGTEWRFLKSAIERWLSQPQTKTEGIWGAAGSWKNDPFLNEMLEEIYRRRGRSMTKGVLD